MSTDILAQAYLHELFCYSLQTGVFTRRTTTSSNAKRGDEAGSVNGQGYLVVRIAGKKYYAHRLAFLYVTGEWPPETVDHIDGDPSNNSWGNLRLVSHAENHKNQKRHSNNTSGVAGVHWHKASGKWQAYIRVNGKQKHLGSFDDKAAAVLVRLAAEIEHGYHPNHGKR